MPAGALIGGLITDVFSVRATFAAAGIAAIVVAAFILVTIGSDDLPNQ